MRTWDENRVAINQLWPQCQWTDEERRLWKDDLSCDVIDQDLLYDALRNVKRTRDTLYPQLKWIRDEYNTLRVTQKAAARKTVKPEPKLDMSGISDEGDKRLCEDFVALIDMSLPEDFGDIEARVLDKLPCMHSASAVRVIEYAKMRLLGQTPLFGRVNSSGDVRPISVGKDIP